MKRILFALCLMCLGCLTAISQALPNNQQSQRKPASSQNAPSPEPPPTVPVAEQTKPATDPFPDFVIGPEDVLEISVWREPDLTSKAVVRPDGKIGVTLLGDVQASGLTTRQLRDSIVAGLGRFVAEPVVSVVVVEIHSQMVHLIGAVGRPGAYPLGGPLTVMELLARAGGIGETAKSEEIAIVRNKGGGQIERIPFNYKAFIEGKNLTHNILLKSGDVVVVR